MTSIGIQYLNVLETQRSNRANEHIKMKTLAETTRHNVASEQLELRSIDESIRHNMAVEAETNRSNIARELEAERHNRATEAQQARSIAESIRHNLATETELNRSNVAREKETSVHNLETESETRRHNEAVESNTRYQTNINALPGNVAGALALKDSGKDTAANKAGASFATAINSLGTLGSAIGGLLRGASKYVFN